MKAVVVAADMITPYGPGIDALWQGILSNRSAISRVDRFKTAAFHSDYAATIPGLIYHGPETLAMQMLRPLLDRTRAKIPADAKLLFATTKGEIDLLEQHLLKREGDASASGLDRLLEKVAGLAGVQDKGSIVSAACTSSAAAVARAAALIRNKRADCVVVVACDSVTEFIFAGFSSLMALDKEPARPFDRNRAGLSVGEAAAIAVIMSKERALREDRQVLGEIRGWGSSDDANHMTGPSRESEGLILAINKALLSAGVGPDAVGLIGAHGTGTVYNDAMEMKAFHAVFKNAQLPVYSIKGGIGHTMGAAGLIETLIAMRALREKSAPPTMNLIEPEEHAAGWVSTNSRPIKPNGLALVTNAGFSGVNTALVLG